MGLDAAPSHMPLGNAPPMQQVKSFRFLDLPPELRLIIYEHLFDTHHRIDIRQELTHFGYCFPRDRVLFRQHIALLQVCRTTRREARKIATSRISCKAVLINREDITNCSWCFQASTPLNFMGDLDFGVTLFFYGGYDFTDGVVRGIEALVQCTQNSCALRTLNISLIIANNSIDNLQVGKAVSALSKIAYKGSAQNITAEWTSGLHQPQSVHLPIRHAFESMIAGLAGVNVTDLKIVPKPGYIETVMITA